MYKDLILLITNICVQGANFSNVTRKELAAISNMKANRTFFFKEADKGSGLIVWDREDYIKESQGQSGDSDVYSKLDSDPSEQLHQIITDAVDIVRDRDIDENRWNISRLIIRG